MPELTLTVTEDELAFIEDHDLDPTELFQKQLGRERQRIRRENPEPHVQDELRAILQAVIEREQQGETEGIGSFMKPLDNAPVSVQATAGDGEVTIRVLVSFERLPSDSVADTMAGSNEFLATVAEQLNDVLQEVGVGATDFELVENQPKEHEYDRHKAKFETTVAV